MLKVETPKAEASETKNSIDTIRKSEPGEAWMKYISRRSRLSKQSPPMTLTLVEDLGYDVITEFWYQLLLGIEPEGDIVNAHTKNLLGDIKSSTEDLTYKVHPISMEKYVKEVKRLREATFSGPSIVIPAIVKTETLDPELKEMGWRRFNFPGELVISPKYIYKDWIS